MKSVRRLYQWSFKHGFALMAMFLALGYGLSEVFRPAPAEADTLSAAVSKLKKVALSDVSMSERLMAIDALKKAEDSTAPAALEEIAKKGKLQVASAACAALGRMKSSTSKGKLKGLLENGDLDTKVRMAAVSCIAEHWRDEGDSSYLEQKCEADKDLKAHCAAVESKVYGK